ncbi:hypothetical protein IWW37_003192 [Coemansia sp. RSA 2050]|nr:hypothetical protein IWW37_003192 [Coemansia sp. RSA 2050]KAJ2733146.1 hypothetical protein IW152_003303 [Coemansia sp. BCRC 34962]
MLFHSILALAASAATVSALGPLPTDIGFLLNQVAELVNGTPYHSAISQAAQSLISNYRLPGKEAQDKEIVSSLLAALNSQNVPTEAASIAEVIASILGAEDAPGKLASLMASMAAELKNPEVNTQIASIVDKLVSMLAQARIEAPELFEDNPVGPTATSTWASASTSTGSKASTSTGASSGSPTSKSSAPSSTSGPATDSHSSSEESSESPGSSESPESSESSKSNGAHPINSLFGYLSIGVAGVVASFF